jgi:ATP-dependent helicase/nuclease subunit A
VDFTPRQLDAVDVAKASQDTCIVAGPGSGKTSVLVEFYRRLVVEAKVPPQNILAITFTEKAARNMKEKLAELFHKMPERRRQLEQANVSTIHGFCARLLRENAIAAGIDPEFSVLDARQSILMQRQAASDALDQMFAAEPEAVHCLISGLKSPDVARNIPSVYDAMRAAGVETTDLRAFRMDAHGGFEDLNHAVRSLTLENTLGWSPSQKERLQEVLAAVLRVTGLSSATLSTDHFRAIAGFPTSLKGLKTRTAIHSLLMSIKDRILPDLYRRLLAGYYFRERETLIRVIERFHRLYGERKRNIGALDYADLETFAVRVLQENRGVREHVQTGFLHVLMDEFQDTNAQQAKLIELLRAPDCFYAVGDINQSIYGFRHADPDVFRAYRDHVETNGKHRVELEENWRSRPDILSAVETISHHAAGIEQRPLVAKKQFPEKLQPSVEVLSAIADTQETALDLEARWVARRILDFAGSLELASGPAGFGDIAVLVRNSEVLGAFTGAFEQAGIPYLLNQGKGFFETREVVDLTCLLRTIDNPRDEISLAAVLRSPFVRVSDEALLRLKTRGNLGSALRRLDHLESEFSADDLAKLRRFREQLFRWRESRDVAGFDRLLIRALDETSYRIGPGSRAVANIEKFLTLAREACSRLTLAEFVDELALMRLADARDPDAPPEDAVNAVRIMTVHAAKGLEFPVVFLVALHKGIQQGVDPLCFSPRLGLGARWLNPASGEEKGDWFHNAIREEAGNRDTGESNRLFYVAMTRAEEHLVFSYSSFGKQKEWAAALEAALSLDLRMPQQRVQRIQAPDGDSFPLRIFATDAAPELLTRREPGTLTAPIQLLTRPEVSGQHDFAASVTSIAHFADCPRRYYLETYLGWPGNAPRTLRHVDDDAVEQLDASEFGLEVHALLAGQPAVQSTPEALKLAGAFRASDLGRRAERASRVEREFGFLMATEDVVLRGQIDLWFEEGGECILVDYKSDNVKARETASSAEFYAPQLRLYALALERITGRPPDRAFVYFLRPGIAEPVSLERSLLDDPEILVRDFREAQSSLDFPLREGEHCARCPYFRGLCPAGSGVHDVIHAPTIDGENLTGDEASVG